MTDDIAIRLRDVSKDYHRHEPSGGGLRGLFRKHETAAPGFRAVQPLDLDVARGEAVGIVGRNGSGKSTLLKMIAGVLQPTTGTVEVSGRISALLELGSGFNPEFTGRENVHYNAAMLGLSKADIAARFDDIVDFSEIGDFLDQPVKTYSSGMTVRLAFAVAINVNPKILIVDEALAVGDVFFQQKCFERVRELRKLGTTLLFVSHDIGAVYKNCSRAILLDRGAMVLDASPREVADLYQAQLILARDERPESMEIHAVHTQPAGAGRSVVDRIISLPGLELERFAVLDSKGAEVELVVSGERVSIAVDLHFVEPALDPHVGFKIRDRMGSVLFETNTYCMKRGIGPVTAGERVSVAFDCPLPLMEGDYTFTLGVADGGYAECLFRHQLLFTHNVGAIKVLRDLDGIIWDGVVNLDPSLEIRRISTGDAAAVSDGREAFQIRNDLSAISVSLGDVAGSAAPGAVVAFAATLLNAAGHDVVRPANLHLSFRWLDAQTLAPLDGENARFALPAILETGYSAPIAMSATAPLEHGRYVLRATLVEEGVRWWDEAEPRVFADAAIHVEAPLAPLVKGRARAR